jgi:hypothetical protein
VSILKKNLYPLLKFVNGVVSEVLQIVTPMHDPIGQKNQSIPQLNLYIKEQK